MKLPRLLNLCFSLSLFIVYPWAGLCAQPETAVLVGAGDIGKCGSVQAVATAKLIDKIEGSVFTAGDNAYPKGRQSDFLRCYDPTWGRHLKRTRPVPGNHDYGSPNAGPYFAYFAANAGPAGRGYYSYDLGAWHIVALNSNREAKSWGAAQERWLDDDLKANPAACTLAYWHHPRFSSGNKHGNHPYMGNLFKILYDHGVELVISGHDHIYERFAPQNPAGKADPLSVRQFIAGTGGASLYKIGTIKPNSEERNTTAHGVLKFTLLAKSYVWEFIPIPGQTSRDRGTAQCSTQENYSR
jgi:hypothetical protein